MAKRTLGDSARAGAEPTAAEVSAELERILRSQCFAHAGRASDFLRFVVGKTLTGEANRIKGYTIAIEVFGRPADFNARSDPLVRVEASRLRQRLTEYYAGEGSAESRPARDAARALCGDCRLYDQPRATARRRRAGAVAAPGRSSALDAHGRRGGCRCGDPGRAWRSRSATTSAVADPPASVPAPAAEGAHRTRIAVVPLENLGTTSRLDRLAAGLTEELMLRLDALDLYVIATQADWHRPGKALDDALGAEHSYVLTGSVRDHAGGTRITVRIIESETGAQIWAAAYDEPPSIEEQPELQAKVARDAAAAAALFGPVFDAELALARRASAHARAAGLPDPLPGFPPRDGPGALSGSVRLFPEPRRAATAARTCMGRPGHAAHRQARLLLGLRRRRRRVQPSAGRRAHGARAGRHERLGERGADALPVLRRRPGVRAERGAHARARSEQSRDARNVRHLVDRLRRFDARPRARRSRASALAAAAAGLQVGARVRRPPRRRAVRGPGAGTADGREQVVHRSHGHGCRGGAVRRHCGRGRSANRLLAVEPSFEAHAAGLVEIWRFEPRLHDAILTGLGEAGLELGQ